MGEERDGVVRSSHLRITHPQHTHSPHAVDGKRGRMGAESAGRMAKYPLSVWFHTSRGLFTAPNSKPSPAFLISHGRPP